MTKETFHDRLILAVRIYMANNRVDNYRSMAKLLNIPSQTLLKIMGKGQAPTVNHYYTIMEFLKLNANWVFFGKGEMYSAYQATLNEIYNAVTKKVTKK